MLPCLHQMEFDKLVPDDSDDDEEDEGMELDSGDETDEDICLDPVEPSVRGAPGEAAVLNKEYEGIGTVGFTR